MHLLPSPGPSSRPWTSGGQTSHSCRDVLTLCLSVAGSDSRRGPSTNN
jgi:hypothetical protein